MYTKGDSVKYIGWLAWEYEDWRGTKRNVSPGDMLAFYQYSTHPTGGSTTHAFVKTPGHTLEYIPLEWIELTVRRCMFMKGVHHGKQ